MTKYKLERHGKKVCEGSGRACLRELRARGYITVSEAKRDGYQMKTLPKLELLFNRGHTKETNNG